MNFEALLLPCLAKSTLNLMWESSHKVPSWAVSKMKEVLAANLIWDIFSLSSKDDCYPFHSHLTLKAVLSWPVIYLARHVVLAQTLSHTFNHFLGQAAICKN